MTLDNPTDQVPPMTETPGETPAMDPNGEDTGLPPVAPTVPATEAGQEPAAPDMAGTNDEEQPAA